MCGLNSWVYRLQSDTGWRGEWVQRRSRCLGRVTKVRVPVHAEREAGNMGREANEDGAEGPDGKSFDHDVGEERYSTQDLQLAGREALG